MERKLTGWIRTALVSLVAALAATVAWAELVGLGPVFGDLEIDRELFWRARPTLLSGVTAEGTRGTPAPAKEAIRIVALGDSSTYGITLPRPGDAYPGQLEKYLRERGVAASVENRGVPGYTLYQGVGYLRKLLGERDADYVLFYFAHNDRQRSRTGLADENRVLAGAPLLGSSFARRSRIVRALQLGSADWTPVAPRPSSERVPIDRYRALVKEAVEICRAHGATSVWMPYRQIPPGEEPTAYNDALREVATEHGARFVALDGLKNAGAEAFLGDGVHPNRRGHAQIAAALGDAIDARGR